MFCIFLEKPKSMAFENLQSETYMSLKTFRKSGEGVATPVWFTQEGDTLFVITNATSGKVKRLRNNGDVEVAPSDVRGGLKDKPYEAAHARILLDGDEMKHGRTVLRKKYGFQFSLFALLWTVRRVKSAVLEITPR